MYKTTPKIYNDTFNNDDMFENDDIWVGLSQNPNAIPILEKNLEKNSLGLFIRRIHLI
jgi:hypothetical protein